MQNHLQPRLLTGAGLFLALTTFAADTQAQSGMDLVHPRWSARYTAAFGEQKFEVADPFNGSLGSGASALFHRVQVEYFLPSQLGFFLNAEFGGSSDTLEDAGFNDSDTTSQAIAFGLSYRATIDDDFRMPVRIGPYFHKADVDGFDTEYSNYGLQLSAQPEYIVTQNIVNSRMSELSVFADLGVGAGPSDVESGDVSETGYAFRFTAELGTKYRFRNGITLGVSGVYRKQNYGLTDSFDDAVFFGTDDDFIGVGLSIGWQG